MGGMDLMDQPTSRPTRVPRRRTVNRDGRLLGASVGRLNERWKWRTVGGYYDPIRCQAVSRLVVVHWTRDACQSRPIPFR